MPRPTRPTESEGDSQSEPGGPPVLLSYPPCRSTLLFAYLCAADQGEELPNFALCFAKKAVFGGEADFTPRRPPYSPQVSQ